MLVYLQMMDSPEDESKFEKIYYHYRGYTYHLAFDILQNVEDAEDIVQHTFMVIAQNLDKIENPISSKTQKFITLIAKNKSIDLYRSKTLHPEVEFNDETTLVDWAFKEFENSQVIKRYLKKLPSQHKHVLILKYVYELTNWEVAKALNLSYKNVIQIDQRAKKKFRELYKRGEKHDV